MSETDTKLLQTIAQKSPTALKVLADWAHRQRHRGPIDIMKNKRALRNLGETVDDKEYEQLLLDLQKAGYGRVLKDHKGQIRFLDLNHPVYKIGKGAIGEQLQEEVTVSVPEAGVQDPAPKAVDRNTVLYCMIAGHRAKLEIAGNVDERTLDRIFAKLQS